MESYGLRTYQFKFDSLEAKIKGIFTYVNQMVCNYDEIKRLYFPREKNDCVCKRAYLENRLSQHLRVGTHFGPEEGRKIVCPTSSNKVHCCATISPHSI